MNLLDSEIKNVSETASLLKLYTTNSVRVTAITLWSNAGITNMYIMAISGHRNEQGRVHHNRRPSTSQFRGCSEVLSNILVEGTTESSPTGTTVRQNNSVMVAHDKNANFLEFVFGNNCTVHGNVNIVFNNAIPPTSGL